LDAAAARSLVVQIGHRTVCIVGAWVSYGGSAGDDALAADSARHGAEPTRVRRPSAPTRNALATSAPTRNR
jgi:hypothetical protein